MPFTGLRKDLVGKRIRQCRYLMGEATGQHITQRVLGELAKDPHNGPICLNTISRYENGSRTFDIHLVTRIMDAFNAYGIRYCPECEDFFRVTQDDPNCPRCGGEVEELCYKNFIERRDEKSISHKELA